MSTVDEFQVADIRNGMTLDEAIEIAAHPSAKAVTYARKNEALKVLAKAATSGHFGERSHDYSSPRCWCGEANYGVTHASGRS